MICAMKLSLMLFAGLYVQGRVSRVLVGLTVSDIELWTRILWEDYVDIWTKLGTNLVTKTCYKSHQIVTKQKDL